MVDGSPAARSLRGVEMLAEMQKHEYGQRGLDHGPEADRQALREIATRELIQENLDSGRPAADSLGEDRVLARIRQLEAYYLADDGDVWSQYERPDHRQRLARLVASVEAAAASCGYTVPRRPVVGTLPTGDINSQRRPGPKGEGDLVIFDSGMFLFAGKIAAVAAQALDAHEVSTGIAILGEDEIIDRLQRIPGIRVQFADLIFSYVVLGDPAYGLTYPPPPPSRLAVDNWAEAVMAFVMAHEYAHVILAHGEVHTPGYDGLNKEIEADHLALELAPHMVGNRVIAYAGASLFLLGSMSLDSADRHFRGALPQNPSSHPPPTDRFASLLAAVAAWPEAAQVSEFGQRLTRAIGGLSGSLVQAFDAAREGGYPEPGWRPSSEYEQHAALLSFLAAAG